MRLIAASVAIFGLASLAAAAPTTTVVPGPDAPIQTVIVGGADLRYHPPILQVAQGSRVHFDFRAKNHTLTESTFDAPCTKLQGTDIDTNFNNPNPNNIPNLHPFDYTFASNTPRYFYCKQDAGTPESHCGQGMVFAVNVDYETFLDFQSNANATLP
jgi:hypothetical protein